VHLPGYDVVEFHTLAVPAGTPAALVARLNQEINKALASPQVRERLTQQNVEIATMTPEQTRAFILAEQEKYARIVKAVGIKPD